LNNKKQIISYSFVVLQNPIRLVLLQSLVYLLVPLSFSSFFCYLLARLLLLSVAAPTSDRHFFFYDMPCHEHTWHTTAQLFFFFFSPH